MQKLLACLACVLAGQISAVQADVITDLDIIPTTGNEIPSGNGLLDFILFNGSTSGDENECEGFNGDDANTDMPGGGVTTATESYITSIGELRTFYELCFPDELVTDVALSVDLNESVSDYITLDALTVVIDYDANYGDLRDDPASGDIDSDTQNLTEANFSGGTTVAWLDPLITPKTLDENEEGAGWADYTIVLGVNPYDYPSDTRILIYWASHDHTDGGDTVFISGEYYVPEPASISLLALGSLALMRRRRR